MRKEVQAMPDYSKDSRTLAELKHRADEVFAASRMAIEEAHKIVLDAIKMQARLMHAEEDFNRGKK
jgi:hypothetical protein